MSQYRIGSVSVTNGSNVVQGLSTGWFGIISPNHVFIADGDAVAYTVASVPDDDTLTLNANYGGTTRTGIGYGIFIDFTPIKSIPLLSPGDLQAWAAFNDMALKVDVLEGGGGGTGDGASQLVELSDVSSAFKTDRFVLVANGTSYAGRLLNRLDVSNLLPIIEADLGSTLRSKVDGPCDEVQYLGETIASTSTALNANNSIPMGALFHSIWTGSSGWSATRRLTLTGSAREKQTFTFGNNSGFPQEVQGASVNTPGGLGAVFSVPNGAVVLFKSEGTNGRVKLEGIFGTSSLASGGNGGAPTLDPDTDAGNYSTTAFQLTPAIAAAGKITTFLNTATIKINVQAGSVAGAEWGFNIPEANKGEITSDTGVKVNGVDGSTGTIRVVAPGFHSLQRLEATDEWVHIGPTVDRDVLFWGPVGGHRVRAINRGGANPAVAKEDSGHKIALFGTSSIPAHEGWQAIFVAEGADRTITYTSFRRASDGGAVGTSHVIPSGALMGVLVHGNTCYLMGL